MTDDAFWSLIATLDWSQTGDDDAVIEPIVAALAARDDAEISGFDDRLADALFALDGKRYARQTGTYAYNGGDHFSVDMFLYARCCVVASGRALFERVRADPTAFPKDMDFEGLLYVAARAFERKHPGEDYAHVTKVSYETYANRAAWVR